MQQKKKEQPLAGVNDAEHLSHIRHNVKRRFEEYRQSSQKQKQEAIAQLKQMVEAMHRIQDNNLAELENNVLDFVDNNGNNHGTLSPKLDGPREYTDADFAKNEEQYNEMNYKEYDFGESSMKYTSESAGQAMQYTEQGLEKAMEAINHSAVQFEKISEGMIY